RTYYLAVPASSLPASSDGSGVVAASLFGAPASCSIDFGFSHVPRTAARARKQIKPSSQSPSIWHGPFSPSEHAERNTQPANSSTRAGIEKERIKAERSIEVDRLVEEKMGAEHSAAESPDKAPRVCRSI